MKIALVGLGLIGGSFAKAIRQHYSGAFIAGYDHAKEVTDKALAEGVINDTASHFSDYDLIIISLYPKATIGFLKGHIGEFSAGCVVVDCCGVKEVVCSSARALSSGSPATFVGGHPMAGRELSGYSNSLPTLYNGASMILTPEDGIVKATVNYLKVFFLSLGFSHVTITTPRRHDEIIAYTSQLAHVVSNAYVQSPTASQYMGFSAGSFADLTRVAKLNPEMWSELFLTNKDILCYEIETLIDNLTSIKALIQTEKEAELIAFLKTGSDIKERLSSQNHKGD